MAHEIPIDQALAGVKLLERSTGTASISGVEYDSRRVRPGSLFVAMRGETTDGNRYIENAIAAGAHAVVTDAREAWDRARSAHLATPLYLIENGRRALAEISANFFDHPERRLKISAVTGTNGKTTTAYLLEQMLRGHGRKCILLGTVETRIGDQVSKSIHTTPESRDLLEIFAKGVRAGCTEVVMEASSHALAQERVWGIPVDVAIFTNLTQDHLDFHGSMEEYARAKAKLFAGVGAPPPRIAVVNVDAEFAGTMLDAYTGAEPIMRYGTSSRAEYRAENIALAAGATHFDFITPQGMVHVASPLTGRVNVENLLAALCAAMARGLTLEESVRAAASLQPAPGRFEVVPGSTEAGFAVVVDYAHTDDALRNLIALGRDLVTPAAGRVITMFGCGGDRDRTKRPKMGRAAAEGSDIVVVTSDNPRSESPTAIIEEIMAGIRQAESPVSAFIEEDRRAAIARAIHSAAPGDIVLLAGKGHEKTQTFAGRTVPFDDVAEAAAVLRTLTGERHA